MVKINNCEEYLTAVTRIFSRRHFYTNNILSLEEMQVKTERGLVYLEEKDWGICILIDVGEYYLAYIYLIRGEKLSRPDGIEKPVVVEMLGTNKRYCMELEEALLSAGFELYANNLEMISTMSDAKRAQKMADNGKRFFTKHGFVFHAISDLTKEYFQKIWDLWTDTIDGYALHCLTDQEYRQLVENDRGMFVTDDSGEVVAAGYYEKSGRICFAHHIAVCKKYNGIGIGGVVMSECMAKAFREEITKYISWIADDNKESIDIHKSIGIFTGKYSKQFILK